MRMQEIKHAYKILIGKIQQEKSLRKYRRPLDIILKKWGVTCVLDLAWDGVQWRLLVVNDEFSGCHSNENEDDCCGMLHPDRGGSTHSTASQKTMDLRFTAAPLSASSQSCPVQLLSFRHRHKFVCVV
jgi:hypothetical protein